MLRIDALLYRASKKVSHVICHSEVGSKIVIMPIFNVFQCVDNILTMLIRLLKKELFGYSIIYIGCTTLHFIQSLESNVISGKNAVFRDGTAVLA